MPVFAAAREHGTAVELNSKYIWEFEGTLALLQRIDPLVSLGSDAHQPIDVGRSFVRDEQLAEVAR